VKTADLHHSSVPLADLRRGDSAVVTGLAASQVLDDRSEDADALLARLRDLGFIAGARCQIVARMWLGGDPLVVRIAGSTFALRRAEAAAVHVLRQQERLSPAALGPKDASAVTV
jgi:ferrous iron transport protein A